MSLTKQLDISGADPFRAPSSQSRWKDICSSSPTKFNCSSASTSYWAFKGIFWIRSYNYTQVKKQNSQYSSCYCDIIAHISKNRSFVGDLRRVPWCCGVAKELMVALVSCVLSPQVPLKSGPDVTPRGGPSGPAVLGCGWPRHAAALWSGWHHQQSGVAALEVGPRCLSVEMCLCTCCVHVELMKHLFAHRWLTCLFMTSFCCWIMSLFSHEFTQTHDAVIYSPMYDESSHTL